MSACLCGCMHLHSFSFRTFPPGMFAVGTVLKNDILAMR